MPWRETPAELARARAEQPVVVPAPTGALYGIFTPPAGDAPAADTCVVLFTRPRLHRNRMWVEAARRLATKGFACFRFDYHGTGDSEGEGGFLDPNRPFREDAVAVLRFLRVELGQRRFIVSGLCFDARTALSAFMDEGEAIEGLVFIASPVMELDTMMKLDADHRTWRDVLRAARKPENWRSLARAERWRYFADVVRRVARRSVGARAGGHGVAPSFVEHFDALVRSRARALFLYGTDDREYLTFKEAERALFAKLPAPVRARFDVEIWPGAVHAGTLDVARQREILERVLGWIEGRHPARSREVAA